MSTEHSKKKPRTISTITTGSASDDDDSVGSGIGWRFLVPRDDLHASRWLAAVAILLVVANLLPIFAFGTRSLNVMAILTDLLFLVVYFGCRNNESLLALTATLAVVSAVSWMYIVYFALYYVDTSNDESNGAGSCDLLLLAGFNSNRQQSSSSSSSPDNIFDNTNSIDNVDEDDGFCHDRFFAYVSFACGVTWLAIAGCLFRSMELRRNARWEELFNRQMLPVPLETPTVATSRARSRESHLTRTEESLSDESHPYGMEEA